MRYHPMFDQVSPWDAAEDGMAEWQDGFADDLSPLQPDEDATYQEVEQIRRVNDFMPHFKATCDRAPALYRTMLSQEVVPDLEAALAEVADIPQEAAGFDGRRLRLTLDAAQFWDCVELELLRDILGHVRTRPAKERRNVYEALLVTAGDGPINAVAAWYLERAARLLLYGLDVECAAMCRAVLEAALRHRIDDDDLAGVGIRRRRGQDFSLYSRIEGATKLMVFTEEESTRAHQIRKDGNEVLHPPDPEQFDRVRRELNARAMVGSLAVLLRKLFPETGA